MKCPLTYKEKVSYYQGRDYGIEDCLKGECAWWDADNGRCILLTIGSKLAYLHSAIKDIRDKMPHEGQFRK